MTEVSHVKCPLSASVCMTVSNSHVGRVSDILFDTVRNVKQRGHGAI